MQQFGVCLICNHAYFPQLTHSVLKLKFACFLHLRARITQRVRNIIVISARMKTAPPPTPPITTRLRAGVKKKVVLLVVTTHSHGLASM